jgi:hypothetical protein
MSVVEKPPVPLQTQLLKVWAFVQNSDGTFSPAPSSGGGTSSNVNLTGLNGSAPGITNPLAVELSDGTNPFGTSGNPLFTKNASIGATGATAPTSATEIGWIDGTGKLQGISASNPLPVSVTAIVADNVNQGNQGTIGQSWFVEMTDGTNVIGVVAHPVRVDPTGTTAQPVTQGTAANLNATVVGTGTFAVQASQTGNWTSRIVGNAGGVLDGVLGATKPANALQVGGNDGTNVFALPLASGGGSLVVSGTVTATSAATGATGSAVPASAGYEGINVAGTLRGVTGVNPSGSIYAQQTDISSILGVTAIAAAAGVLKVGVVGNAGAAFDGAPAAAIPANAVMVGGSDGTNLRALSTDTNGNLNVNSFVQPTSVPNLVQSVATPGGASPTNPTTMGTCTQGNLLVFVSRQAISGITDTAGNVWLQLNSTFWYVANCKGGANTVTVTSGAVQGQICEFSGIALSSPLDANTTASPGTVSSFNIGPATTTGPDDLCIVAFSNNTTNSPTWSATGYSNAVNQNNAYLAWRVRTVAGAETAAVNCGGSLNVNNPVNMVCFKALVSSTVSQGLGLITPAGAWTTVPTLPTDGTLNNNVFQRMPNIWRGNQFAGAGTGTIWQPQTGKKARLMRYRVQVGEDSTISGGPLPINVAFSEQLGTVSGAALAFPGFGFTHRVVVPASVLATSGELYDSNWADLGNGQILTSASAALLAGIQVPQSTSAVNPAWTIASNQWEAATVGFKTASNAGIFKLVQQTSGVASAASVALPAISVAAGNSLFVFIRTTNIAGGAPTVVVTDTASNSWTTSALTTNASDGTNGSSICVAYATNIKGNAANVITVTTSVHASTQIEAIAIEYSNAAGGIDAALVGTTGNSTTPASGNYTPATAGDLLFSFFATSASIATQPTVGSNFVLRGTIFNATQGCLCVADNFGNGALTAGVVNIQTAGTEE